MNILLILLGCNIYSILLNRLESSLKFIEENIHIKTTNNPNELIQKNNSFGLMSDKIGKIGKIGKITKPTKLTWFLSGGIKNNFEGAESEASIMKSQIDNIINLKYNPNQNPHKYNRYNCASDDLVCLSKFAWNYILDEKSSNTAENFVQSSHFLNTTKDKYEYVYVITSSFHYKRAQMMLNLIDPSRNFKWILGDLEEQDSRYWESIHINNVGVDVSKAQAKFANNLI